MKQDEAVCIPYMDLDSGEVFFLPKVESRRNFNKKRPLGRLESDARYTPRQPVLSSRTLDIDRTGARTYRAKSTSAIIQEQHQLLHDVYTSRSAKSAGSGAGGNRKSVQTQTAVPQQQVDPKRRRFLTINGQSPQRPWTSVERPKSVKKSDGHKKRPHTTAGRARPATDTHLKLEIDSGVQASTKALNRVQEQVRELWQTENHRIEEGVFGRGEVGPPDCRSGTWLSFTGGGSGHAGIDDVDAGLVQAFTAAMRGRSGEFYTIDSSVGTQVARQLRRGDRVRVGINGNVQSTTLRVKRWRKDQQNREEEEEEAHQGPPSPGLSHRTEEPRPPPVPLCWADQISHSEKVMEARTPTKPLPKKNLCETRPVIFERLLAEDPLGRHYTSLRNNPSSMSGGTGSAGGFAVRSRTKPRVGIDGSTTQSITHLTIAPDEEEVDLDAMSVEDVLERQLAGLDRKSPELRRRPDLAIPNLTDIRTHHADQAGNKRKDGGVRTPPTSARSQHGKTEVPSPPPSRAAGTTTPWGSMAGSGGDSRSVRPLTAHSMHSIDQNIDTFVVTASNSTQQQKPTSAVSRAKTPGSARSGAVSSAATGNRATSGKRPPPAKPMLHKSSAAQGASIGGNGKGGGDTSYIQISQGIASPQQQAAEAAARQQAEAEDQGGIPPPTPASLDGLSMDGGTLVDQDLNPDEFPELGSDLDLDDEDLMADLPEEEIEYETGGENYAPQSADDADATIQPEVATTTPRPGTRQSETADGEGGGGNRHARDNNAAPTSAASQRSSVVSYAFNIPTAADDDDDEALVPPTERQQSLHDRLVEQTTDLLAGALIGADLPSQLSGSQ